MATAVAEGVREEILLLTPTANVTTVSGTIPAREGEVAVIDWINGWCVNPSAGAGYGTTISMAVSNDLAEEICGAYDDGYSNAASAMRSVFQSWLGGVASTAMNSNTVSYRKNKSCTVAVTIDGAANDGGTNYNLLGGSVGYHYEPLGGA